MYSKSAFRRDFGMSTRVLNVNSCFNPSRASAFTPYRLKGSCPQTRLAGRSRSSRFDNQDLQQRPVVLSGRPFHLTSYLLDPRDPAQKLREMNQIPVLFPGCQGSNNPYCRSILADDGPGYCCQDDEDYERASGKGKHVTMACCPEQTIQKPSLSGQRFAMRPNYHGQLPGGGMFEHYEALELTPKSETRKSSDYLEDKENGEKEEDEKEREEQEEQLKEFSYEEEPRNGKCSSIGRDEPPARFIEEYGNESAILSSVDHRGNEIKVNGAFQRIENKRQRTSTKHGPAHCRNLCCRASTSILHSLGNMYRNTGYAKSDVEGRGEHMSTNWSRQNHLGGTTCLVCFKTLKRSHYMKSHMLIHTGEKPYKCAYCDKSFNQIGNRNAHQRIHTGEKPYACKYCGQRFIFNSSKHNHMKVHCQSSSVHLTKDDSSNDELMNS